MIKAILFDFWGTLVENGTKSPIKQVKTILRIDVPFSEYVMRMERAMMTRNFSTLEEAFSSVCAEFNVPCTPVVMEKLIGMWNKSWMLAIPYQEVEEMLQQLQGRYRLFLISNTDCFSIHKVLEKYPLQKYFERMFFSCDLGMIKTDKSFLTQLLGQAGLMVEECVLIGDSLQSDILAAQKVGMKAILIDRQDSRDFQPKIKNLYEVEEILPGLQK